MKKEKRLGSIERSRNVPQLRFPEFKGEWEEKRLGNITKKVGSGSTPKGGVKVYTDSGIPFIRSQNVYDNQLQLDEIHIPLTIHRKMANSKVLPNDVLLNITGGSIGRSCVVPSNFKEGNVNQHVAIIRLKNNNSQHFLQAILASSHGQKLIYQGMTGSGREGLNFQSIRAFKIAFPSFDEQQKIANFLTAIDRRLQGLEKKKRLLEAYKKGVMQQIFKQEIRFKIENEAGELVEPPDWEKKKFGDFLSIPEKIIPDTIDKSKILTVRLHLKGVFVNDRTESLKIGATRYIKRRKGQFIYGKQNLFNGAFGIVPKKLDGYVSSADIPTLDINTDVINRYYFYYYLSRTSYYKRLENISIGSGSKRIHENTLLKLKIKLPCIEEQTKIADFLSAIDRKIDLVGVQIEKTTEYKKGLLQQLFI